MTARRSFPIGIIIMILVMALAILGVGYAWWTEQLSATGTIQTGSIDVKWENLSSVENDPLDVATCTTGLSNDGKSLTIQLENAYPGYACTFSISLRNYGTVPAKVTNVVIPESAAAYRISPSGEFVSRDGLNPSLPKTAGVKIEIQEAAGENQDYSFDFRVDVAQGNAP